MTRVILFDGECHLCNSSVQFIIKRDPNGYFQFASLQSEIAKTLLQQYQLPEGINSFVLIEDGKAFIESTAALRVCRRLTGFWSVLYALIAVPRPVRDLFYKIIAANRHRLFGKQEKCMLPSPDVLNRFLK